MKELKRILIEAKLHKWLKSRCSLSEDELYALSTDITTDYVDTNSIVTSRLKDIIEQCNINADDVVDFLKTLDI